MVQPSNRDLKTYTLMYEDPETGRHVTLTGIPRDFILLRSDAGPRGEEVFDTNYKAIGPLGQRGSPLQTILYDAEGVTNIYSITPPDAYHDLRESANKKDE